MTTPEVTRMITSALSGRRSLRGIEDYLDWRENTARNPTAVEVASRRVSLTPKAPIALVSRRLPIRRERGRSREGRGITY
jgi:hypothetical protein